MDKLSAYEEGYLDGYQSLIKEAGLKSDLLRYADKSGRRLLTEATKRRKGVAGNKGKVGNVLKRTAKSEADRIKGDILNYIKP